ncbi:aminotransferase class IV [Aestuariibacter halophilus]|uniref:branched-chain-amino-acid transaminase n=1 Tax=Fluctibacter halophilus TaxID=226011 RepID=A0ABS8G446_9ALTE|nr:aminotransferase class IV [Aestuariibacter halophilus]MCC2615367.1 aminotransferase class IV [Aestuariibacter halophilus]
MTDVYLNGTFLPLCEAHLSPLDRGFLFGDGAYEVIPAFAGKPVATRLHLQRLANSLAALRIDMPLSPSQWQDIIERLLAAHGAEDVAIYLHVSRGVDSRRYHGFSNQLTPTVFAMTYALPPRLAEGQGLRVITEQDQRWRHCHIKSTSLLGHVLHFQHGKDQHADEVLLFNQQDELTEAAACNAFVVIKDEIWTPALDQQKLAGITRQVLIDCVRKDGVFTVREGTITRQQVMEANEVWLTSSTRNVQPVISIDDQPVNDGQVGDIWRVVSSLFEQHKFSY